MSPIFILVGAIGLLVNLVLFIRPLDDEEGQYSVGCGLSILSMFLLLVIQYTLPDNRYYVSGWNDRRHIYGDCSHKKNAAKDCRVCTLSAFLMCCTDDCQYCEERKKNEIEAKERERKERLKQLKEQQHLRDISAIKGQIQVLQGILDSLEAGHDIYIEDYTFRRDCEEEIREEAYEYVEDHPDEFFEEMTFDPADIY